MKEILQLIMTTKFYGDNITATEKKCSHCQQWKPFNQFSPSKTGAGRLKGKCLSCEDLPYIQKVSQEKRRDYMLQSRYGITHVQLTAMWESKNRTCHICSTTLDLKEVHVDHCHTSGEVRGVLCRKCNVGLGMFKDDPELLLKAVSYLGS